MSADSGSLSRLHVYLDRSSRARETVGPFRVREAIWAMREILSCNPDVPSDTLEQIARSAQALNGVCHLSVDMAWDKELRQAKWWKRRKLAETKHEWKKAKHIELEDAATADVRQLVTLAN